MKTLYGFIMIFLISISTISISFTSKELNESYELRQSVTSPKIEYIDYDTLSYERDSENRIRFFKEEINCLSQNIYFEARGELKRGQTAVALVTLNRVFSPYYPNTVCEVVKQHTNNSCQFSWICDDNPIDIRDKRAYNRIYRNAEFIYINYFLNERSMIDITDGATHYHARHVSPFWSQHPNYELVADIGLHRFYRPTYE